MYELVPPISKLVEFESPFLKGVVFKLKILNFEEDEKTSSILFESAKDEKGEIRRDDKDNLIIDEEKYYIEYFKLIVAEIEGVEGKFRPSWKVIKSVVNHGQAINSSPDLVK